ncbi:hypothetical protein L202_07374 [Cryptococcus amylolentus CBS 6039]|uniref:Importin N-terminal domain-containing protein n=1 Tax=Cryptococcus amylolentus CBS 6039 TaxID=1295533 RepID=A0A1E3HEJ1_9TREE|nr:hypothetical protein L202_07374 [Cryptococcus amylolentus CBS 6039]ODN73851.1 hypothetical protein L202_07374 [Cryptococcus amylolentus CBS 6039]
MDIGITLDEEVAGPSSLSLPVIPQSDLEQVAQTILQLYDPVTSSNPQLVKEIETGLQGLQHRPEAWGLLNGLAGHPEASVRFFAVNTTQHKIASDWNSLPDELRPVLLNLLLQTLHNSVDPSTSHYYELANALVTRKLFVALASILLRIELAQFQHPIQTVLELLQGSLHASRASIPPQSLPEIELKTRLLELEWCGIFIEEMGRAGLTEQRRTAIRNHIELDRGIVLNTIIRSMSIDGSASPEKHSQEATAACRCAESWIGWGLEADNLHTLVPNLYTLLPLPQASSTIVEVLSESIWKYGKGTKMLTEPLIEWTIGAPGQALVRGGDYEPTDELIAFSKLIAALIEHSSDWFLAHIHEDRVQAFLGVVLRITGWQGTGGVEEEVSQLTLPVYSLLQESLMDSDLFQAPHETDPSWQIAKQFFSELVSVTRRKVRWPGNGEVPTGEELGDMDNDDREAFDAWRRDAGEVIVSGYYVLREEMMRNLTQIAAQQVQSGEPWQDIEATIHCIRYSSEAVPLGEGENLPVLFGDQVLGLLALRQGNGLGENRLRLTVVCLIQSYEEWFKYHPSHLPLVLSYLVPSLTSQNLDISRSAAFAFKAICDMCRKNLVEHIGAFADLHGKIGGMKDEEQVMVIQGITSVIQALQAADAIGPVEGIIMPIIERISVATSATQSNPIEAQPVLVQALNSLTSAFKGLSTSDDDMFDTSDDPAVKEEEVAVFREDPRLVALRERIYLSVEGAVGVWNGDVEVADALSSLLKNVSPKPPTLISLPPLPLLNLVTLVGCRAPSALWFSIASTLILSISAPPSFFSKKKKDMSTEEEDARKRVEEEEKWQTVGNAGGRLVEAAQMAFQGEGMKEHPDIVEGWFKFCHSLAERFPGVLLRLQPQQIEAYIQLGLAGLALQERFSLKSASDFFVALLSKTRNPSPLEDMMEPLLDAFGPALLRALILSAGSEGPRSVIPNLAELLANLVTRVSAQHLAPWLDGILGVDGFPDVRATPESKKKLKDAVLRSRTTRRMREALHEFALVARGLEGTTYGNATAM